MDLVIDGNKPNLLAAAGEVWKGGIKTMGVYLSSDGGDAWTTIRVCSQKDSIANAVAMDPSSAKIIYAGGGDKSGNALLFKSTDGGVSWTKITGGIKGSILGIAVDPISPAIVYVVTRSGVWKSVNGGMAWAEQSVHADTCLIINPKNPNELFAAGSSGVFYSADQGGTWQSFNANWDISDVLCLDLDPVSRTLYASVRGSGIWKRKL